MTTTIDVASLPQQLTDEANRLQAIIERNRDVQKSFQSFRHALESVRGYLTDLDTGVARILTDARVNVAEWVATVEGMETAATTAADAVDANPEHGQHLATMVANVRQAIELGLSTATTVEACDAALDLWADVAAKVTPARRGPGSATIPFAVRILNPDGTELAVRGAQQGVTTPATLRIRLNEAGADIPARDYYWTRAMDELKAHGDATYQGFRLVRLESVAA